MADMKEPSDGCSLGKEEVDVCEREVQRKKGGGGQMDWPRHKGNLTIIQVHGHLKQSYTSKINKVCQYYLAEFE